MWIEVSNLRARVSRATQEELEWLDDYLSFKDERARFRRKGAWRAKSRVQVFDFTSNTFPAGFAGAVQKAAAMDDVRVELVDKRTPPVPFDPTALIDWLRDHQAAAIAVARQNSRGVFHHPTGSGKTEIMVALAEAYFCRWVILTHRKDLLVQTAERFLKRTGETIGIVGDGHVDTSKRVTILMFQSANAALDRDDPKVRRVLEMAQGVMVDEAHVVPAKSFWQIAMATPNAYYRYGFSGTPFARGDQKSVYLWGAIGPVIHRVFADELVAKEVLARPRIRMLPLHHKPLDVQTWAEAYGALISTNEARNALVLDAVRAAEKPCLLFVKEIAHGKLLERAMRRAGVAAEFVWGAAKTEVRRAAIRRLVHGDVDVLVCNVIFQEGVDIPELQSVVLAAAGKSVIAVIQDIGRGMRRKNSVGATTKEEFIVYDISDKGCGCKGRKKHRSCRWMEEHARKRIRAYTSERYEVTEQPLVRRAAG